MFHLLIATFGLYIALHVAVGVFVFAYTIYNGVKEFFNVKAEN